MTPKSSVPPRFQHHRHRGDREEMDGVQQTTQGTDRIRVDSEESETNKDQSILSGVSDWSAEVEEEDERRSLADRPSPCDRRTPPTARPRSPLTARPRSPGGPRHGGPAPGMIRIPENINNPHWRPPPDSRNPAWRSQDREPDNWRSGGHSSPGSWQPIPTAPSWSAPTTPTSSWGGPPPNVQGQRVLYDPKNPSKPIR